MLKDKDNQLSIYLILYNKIPENHTLKVINSAIDLSFVTELLEESYSRSHGRPAKDPELMIRLLILQHLYNLSDIKVIEEASLNLAYMYFLGINPDEDLPDPSLLAKFRVHRLQNFTLDEVIVEVVRQCVEKGIIKDTGISIDATHTAANTFKATPERVMKRLANKIFKAYEKESGDLPENINQNIPNYSYNKDSDEWFCSEGNNTVSRKYLKKKDGTERFKYYFEKEVCRNCSKRSECISGKNIGRILEVGLNTSEFYSYSQEQKSEEFKEKYKSRAFQEGKNGEMKIHHGLDRARGYGTRSMSTQAKLTALAVNLKRIANILSSKAPISLRLIQFYIRIYRNIVFIR